MKNNPFACKNITYILLILLVLLGLSSCKTGTMYFPAESVRTEYKDRLILDSVYLKDSVLIRQKGDTVFLEKYKYFYRDKLLRDSIFLTDSIQVPYPVEVEKEVNRLSSFQSFEIWCGRILLLVLLSWIGIRFLKSRFF